MSSSLKYIATLLIIAIYITNAQSISKSVCTTDKCANLPDRNENLYIKCDDRECELECSNANSCDGILYSCGDLDDYTSLNSNETSSCTINCPTVNSCANLTVVSSAGITNINCNGKDSCNNANFVCNPSSELDLSEYDTECNLNCNEDSCKNINYLCTGYTSQCNADCSSDNSCKGLDMICDQHLTNNINTDRTCDLLCNDDNSCDSLSQFECTDDADAQCSCNGDCNAISLVNIDTGGFEPNTTDIANSSSSTSGKQSKSHTFDIVDVDVYATFTILWLLLFIFSLFLCWRLQVTLDFFRVKFFLHIEIIAKSQTNKFLCAHRIYELWCYWWYYLYLKYFIIGYFVLFYGQILSHIALNQVFIFMFGHHIYL